MSDLAPENAMRRLRMFLVAIANGNKTSCDTKHLRLYTLATRMEIIKLTERIIRYKV